MREAARQCASGKTAETVFRDRFKVSLEDLVGLYGHPGWRHARGGNQWSEITLAIIVLRDSIDQGDAARVTELLYAIPNLRHNTGTVNSKIGGLEASRERLRGERLW